MTSTLVFFEVSLNLLITYPEPNDKEACVKLFVVAPVKAGPNKAVPAAVQFDKIINKLINIKFLNININSSYMILEKFNL